MNVLSGSPVKSERERPVHMSTQLAPGIDVKAGLRRPDLRAQRRGNNRLS